MTDTSDLEKRREIHETAVSIVEHLYTSARGLKLLYGEGLSPNAIAHAILDKMEAQDADLLDHGALQSLLSYGFALFDHGAPRETVLERGRSMAASEMPALLGVDPTSSWLRPMADAFDRIGTDSPSARKMRRLIDRLLEQAPKISPGDAPALECTVIVGNAVLQGVMSKTPDGMLRMLSQGPDRTMMMEQFFDPHDVVLIGVPRLVTATAPRFAG